jgi:peptidoglycan/LPS O-acetylase OafA/YrhL
MPTIPATSLPLLPNRRCRRLVLPAAGLDCLPQAWVALADASWQFFGMGTLRFLLALSVAAIHAAGMFGFAGTGILPGNRAVQIFYMISGFLMTLILTEKYADTPHGNWIFYTNRVLKIFVPYLVILGATVIVCLVCWTFTGNALQLQSWFDEASHMSLSTWAFGLLTNLFIIGQEWSFLLIYRGGSLLYSLQAFAEPPAAFQFIVILPAWTLSLELLFYAIAPFIVRRHILLIAALALASYFLRWSAYHNGYYSEATNYRFFPFELSLFLYGSLAFRLGKFLPPIRPKWAVVATVAILIIVFVVGIFLKRQYQIYAVVGVFLPWLFEFSRLYKWDRALGELSYPLYLVHWPVLGIIALVTRAIEPALIGTMMALPIAAVAIAVAAAGLVNRFIVDPIDDWRQKRAKTAEMASVQAMPATP